MNLRVKRSLFRNCWVVWAVSKAQRKKSQKWEMLIEKVSVKLDQVKLALANIHSKELDLAEKAEMIQYGSMGLARKMLAVLADVDRALSNIDDDDQSPVAQGLRLLRNKMWHELSGDGVSAIEAKGNKFDPAKMEAITTIPASDDFPSGTVVDEIEAGYMYKQKVLIASRVVVASED